MQRTWLLCHRSVPDVIQMQLLTEEKYQKCINLCYGCAQACDACTAACLNEKDVKKLTMCIELNQDCAEACVWTARYMARNSVLSEAACSMCAEICDACADECEKHKTMEHCVKCAKACRETAKECRKMLK